MASFDSALLFNDERRGETRMNTISPVVQPTDRGGSMGQGTSTEDGKNQLSISKVVSFTRKNASPEQGWEDRRSPQTLLWLVSFQHLIGALSCRLRGISSMRADNDFAEVMQRIECELLSFIRRFEGLEVKPEDGQPDWDLLTRVVLNIRMVPPVSDAAYEMLQRFDDLLRMRQEELTHEREKGRELRLQTPTDSKAEEKVSVWKAEAFYKGQVIETLEVRGTRDEALDQICDATTLELDATEITDQPSVEEAEAPKSPEPTSPEKGFKVKLWRVQYLFQGRVVHTYTCPTPMAEDDAYYAFCDQLDLDISEVKIKAPSARRRTKKSKTRR
jgi:hypothetical protein